jgi:hypothetical protein
MGEGRGEGFLLLSRNTLKGSPHPNPLPEYRERELISESN